VRHRWFVPVSVVVIVGLLLAGLPLRARLIAERERAGLQELELDKLPPLGAASLLLLGGFRGVAVDILWLRVIALHQERKYEEERSLIELITRLQPFYISVWAWQAWNIAYNISVQYPEDEEQWKWVRNGIDFLKEGIQLNPENGDLYFYLAIMHRDKVSQNRYFEDAMERDMGVNNLEEAAKFFDRARKLGGVQTFHPRVVDSGVFHSYLARVDQILRRSKLTDELEFTPETRRKAETFIDRCRQESDGLATRWPTDAAFEMFPARIDLVYADGYLKQIDKVLSEGRFSGEAVERARKVLDKGLAQIAGYRLRYEPTRSGQVIRNKTSDAYGRIPWALLRRAGEVMNKPFAGPVEWQRAGELLRTARKELDRVPPAARDCRDVTVLNHLVPEALKSLEKFIQEHREPTSPGPRDSVDNG